MDKGHQSNFGFSQEEEAKWYKQHDKIKAQEHDAIMRKMGISPIEHEEWHKKQTNK